MTTRTYASKILWCEAIGFLAIIILSWVNELSELPQILGHAHYISNWRESLLETEIVVLVALPVMIFTRRIVLRLYYLEGFLRVCAWCKKLEHNGQWVPLEEFFEQRFQTPTSHGMCEECLKEVRANREKSKAA